MPRGGRFDSMVDRFESICVTESKLAEFRFELGQDRLLPSTEFHKLLQNNLEYASLRQDKSSTTPNALFVKYRCICDYCFSQV